MKNNSIAQLVIAAVLIVVAFLLVNPTGMSMPDSAHMLVLAIAIVACGAYAVFVVAERSGDERDETHKMMAGRTAFLVGGGILLIAIVSQSLAHSLDPWLVAALIGMVLAKASARLFGSYYR
ncbi:MAG: hypothetical protein P4L81_06670 [Candidatus Pacebacteria bacterium]|nr:hypothetical protein [Candidatus Paceibacterota bacterium]